jgi:UDP-glucose 4-epimerase
MRILVTGGAGFIGSHVVQEYLRAGHEVAILDDFTSGKQQNVRAGVKVYEGQVQNRAIVERALQEFQPDAVNHHAAQISVVASVRDPRYDAECNVLGTTELLCGMVAHVPQAKLIYISSGGAMYGNIDELPYREDSTPKAAAPYGLSKFVAEQYVWLFARLHGVRATVLRYSNVYGPRQDPHGEAGVCAIFADRMLEGKPVTVYGDGTATRDYIYVGDVAAANLAALSRGDGEPFNISTGVETSTSDVFRVLADAFGYEQDPARAPLRAGEATRVVLSPKKAQQQLGWQPTVGFEEGVQHTVAWYKGGKV